MYFSSTVLEFSVRDFPLVQFWYVHMHEQARSDNIPLQTKGPSSELECEGQGNKWSTSLIIFF